MRRLFLCLAGLVAAGCQTPLVQPADPSVAHLTKCIGAAQFGLLSEPARSPGSLRMMALIDAWQESLAAKVPNESERKQYQTWGTNTVANYGPPDTAIKTAEQRNAYLLRCEQTFGRPATAEPING